MTTKAKQAPAGKDLMAFRKLYDKSLIIPEKIRAGLAILGESWELEGDFVKRTGIAQAEFSKFRDQFAEYFFEARQPGKGPVRIWAGTADYAQKLRATYDGIG